MVVGQTNIAEVIAQAVAETARAAVQGVAVAGAENSAKHERTQNAGPKIDRAVMKQHTFNWKAEDKYKELTNFRLEVNNIFKSYNALQIEKIAIIKND